MTVLRRSQHFTDTKLAGQLARRTLRNWTNYQTPSGLWMPTDPAIEDTASIPDDWEGPDFNFSKHVARGPLQLYFGDTSDPDNTTMIGARLSDNPRKWVQIQAQGVTPGVPMQVVAEEKRVQWKDLWPKSSLVYQAMPNGFRKYIHLREGHPASFRFAVRIPAGGSIVPAGDDASILDGQGQVCLRIPAPWGVDSSQGDPQDGMGQSIRVEMEWGASFTEPSGNHVQVFRFAPNQDDLDSAVYPVLLDPTVKIEGTTDIEDNFVINTQPSNNWGGSTSVHLRSGRSPLVRISTIGSIPSGTLTAMRYFSYTSEGIGGTANVFIVTDANDWVEGTGAPAAQIGSSCWTHAKYATQPWAGANGCSQSGVDYDADGSPPVYTAASGWTTMTLIPAWATAWRDGVRLPNGFVVRFSGGNLPKWWSTENGSLNPYFEIDYTPAGGAAQRFFFMGGGN